MCADAHQTKALLPLLHPTNWSLNAKNNNNNSNPTLFCPWKLNIIYFVYWFIYIY
jgi:hypothetical protein